MEKPSMTTKEQWNKIIAAKLKPGQTIEDLSATYDSGIVMDPHIVAEEVAHLVHEIPISKPWVNMAHIRDLEDGACNAMALQALHQGANGLSLELYPGAELQIVLDKIQTQYLQVRIVCLDWSPDQVQIAKSSITESQYPNITWVGPGERQQIHIPERDRVEHLRSAISALADHNAVDIIVTLSKDLLFEIASLRAIKILLQKAQYDHVRVAARYDVAGSNALGDYDLIERTYKVMSAIMGTADLVMTDYNGDEASRLALNIHNVLELESGFKWVHDPVSGSFYIEKLVAEIIHKVENP